MGRPYRCQGAGGASAADAAEVGIYINEGTIDAQHGAAQLARNVDRIRYRSRIGASARPEPR